LENKARRNQLVAWGIRNPVMKPALLTAFFLTTVALPAGAQTVAMTSTNASSALLVTSQPVRPQPGLVERRALAMAAFERPQPLLRADTLERQRPKIETPPIEPKDEWTSDAGLRIKGAQLAYKTRF
jgi:hypothetical protein